MREASARCNLQQFLVVRGAERAGGGGGGARVPLPSRVAGLLFSSPTELVADRPRILERNWSLFAYLPHSVPLSDSFRRLRYKVLILPVRFLPSNQRAMTCKMTWTWDVARALVV